MNPEGMFSIKDLDRFLFEAERRFKQKEVMNPKEAAQFIGVSVATLYKSEVPFHKIPGIDRRLYLKSEIIQVIKSS
jgi:hypothetical protein